MLTAHEIAIGRMYGHVDTGAPDSHEGYLNFGLWEDGIQTYVAAAENMVERLGSLLGLGAGARLVDAACGRGTQDFHLLETFGDITIDAVDITRRHVEWAKQRAAEWPGPGRARFHLASATRLPFPAASFTHAMSLEAAHHFDTREAYLREAFRVLEPGGRIALADFTLRRTPRGLLQTGLLETVCQLWRIPRANAISREGYEETLRRVGFTDITFEDVGALTFPGYYHEQRSPERRRELLELRGRFGAAVGAVMNYAAYRVYQANLVDYVLVSARKPA
jgi:SAM-dependent methyltransferase